MQGSSAEISLSKGQLLTLTTDKAYYDQGDEETIYVDYGNITKVMDVGGIIYVDDGLISLQVVEKSDKLLLTKVMNDAKLGSKKGVNLPNIDVDLPALSEQDKKDIQFGVEQEVRITLSGKILLL